MFNLHFMKVSTENDNNLGHEKITILVDNMPLISSHKKTIPTVPNVFFTWIFKIGQDGNTPYTCII